MPLTMTVLCLRTLSLLYETEYSRTEVGSDRLVSRAEKKPIRKRDRSAPTRSRSYACFVFTRAALFFPDSLVGRRGAIGLTGFDIDNDDNRGLES